MLSANFIKSNCAIAARKRTYDCKHNNLRTTHSENDLFQFKRRIMLATRSKKTPFLFISPRLSFL